MRNAWAKKAKFQRNIIGKLIISELYDTVVPAVINNKKHARFFEFIELLYPYTLDLSDVIMA